LKGVKLMTEIETINRKIFLKNQARQILKEESDKLKAQALLIQVKRYFEKQIRIAEKQQELSRHLDMIESLLQAVKEVY